MKMQLKLANYTFLLPANFQKEDFGSLDNDL